MASYQQVLELDPNHVEALNNLGVALHAQGKIDEAMACLRRAVTLKPDYADAHSNLGNALKEQGKLDEAVACYRQALELNPASSMLTTTWEMRSAPRESWPSRWRAYERALRSSRTIPRSG